MPHIAVAGAGIGGLTAALALARVGCKVTVFERTATVTPFGAGLQLPPNATVVLIRLGLLDAICERAVAPTEILIRRGRDGLALAHIPIADKRYSTPFLFTLRAHLQTELMSAVQRESAITLRFACGVTDAIVDRDGRVKIVTDEAAEAGGEVDGLVAADGIHSAIRRRLAEGAPDDAVAAGKSAWRSLIPREALTNDAILPRSNLWLGARAHLVYYPVDGGSQINVVATVDDDAVAPDDATFWSTPADPSLLLKRYRGWAEPALRLIAAAPTWRKWPLFDRPPLPRWSRGPVTLLGDAAHPMLPTLGQGAAQAIEDAAVLADCIADRPREIAAAFARYEMLRRPRTSRIQLQSRKLSKVYQMRRPSSLMRDVVLRSLGPQRLAASNDWLYAGPG